MNHLTRPKSHTQHRNAASIRSGTQLMAIRAFTSIIMLQYKDASLAKENVFSIFIIRMFFYLVDSHYNYRGKNIVFWDIMACG